MAQKKKKVPTRRGAAKKSAGAKRRSKPGTRRKTSTRKAGASATSRAQAAQTFVWHELNTNNKQAANAFYTRLFGWGAREMEMGPAGMYTVFMRGGQDIGGMLAMTPDWGDTPPHWMIYVAVDDVDASAARCEALGGKVTVPPTDIPVGRFAVLNDPTGAAIAIYKSNMT